MILLALDTCLAACSAAVRVERDGVARLAGRFEARRTGHAEVLPGMIADCAREAGIAVGEIDRIAVTRGPGTFTGVRVGVAAARALALATGAPIVAVTSLALIAATALAGEPGLAQRLPFGLAAVAGGPQDYLYAQRFDHAGRATSQPFAAIAGEVLAGLAPGTLAVGPAAARLAAMAQTSGRAIATLPGETLPDARVLALIAGALEPIAGPLLPLYLRPPDAKPQDGTSMPRVS